MYHQLNKDNSCACARVRLSVVKLMAAGSRLDYWLDKTLIEYSAFCFVLTITCLASLNLLTVFYLSLALYIHLQFIILYMLYFFLNCMRVFSKGTTISLYPFEYSKVQTFIFRKRNDHLRSLYLVYSQSAGELVLNKILACARRHRSS